MNLIVSGIMSTPASSYSVKQGSLATCPGSLVPVPSPEGRGRCHWFLSGRFQLFVPRKLLNTKAIIPSSESLRRYLRF